MKNIFSFFNQKGGVGKTTSVINIAYVLASEGYKTLIVDMDAQANATNGIGEDKATLKHTSYQLIVDNFTSEEVIKESKIKNLFIIPSSQELSGADIELISKEEREFILRKKLSPIRNQFDFILIDCPPSLGLITVNCLNTSNYIIIPLQCEYYALEGLGLLLNTYNLIKEKLNPNLEIGGVLLTMADFRTNLTQQVVEEVRNYFKEAVFKTIIPRSVKLSEAPSFGQPAILYDPHNRGSKGYQEAGKEFIRRFVKKDLEKKNENSLVEIEGPASSSPHGVRRASVINEDDSRLKVHCAPLREHSSRRTGRSSAKVRGDDEKTGVSL